MKRRGKSVVFLIAILIFAFTAAAFCGIHTQYGDKRTTYVKGISDIRWGIDIRGGIDATFVPDLEEGQTVTHEDMQGAEAVIKQRLVTQNITDYEIYTDYNKNRIIVRFPWKADEEAFDPEAAISELGDTAVLTFRMGNEQDAQGKPAGETASNIILTGSDVKEAMPVVNQQTGELVVQLELEQSGVQKFSDATAKQAPNKGTISIWMDEELISAPTVNDHITNGTAIISGNFDTESATALADKINGGSLTFKLKTESFNTISPTLGENARNAMGLSGIIAYLLVCILMICWYKLPGVVASITVLGQAAATIAAISGFFPAFSSFTLTLPGIAGIILAIGMGVDANIITAERIREELATGKSVEGAINVGFKRAFTAIFDGNLTVIIIAIILMGAFGPPSSIFAKAMNWLFFMFGASTAGAIYSFGYTLMVGVILNFLLGVTASRLMLESICKIKAFRNPKLYGGEQDV